MTSKEESWSRTTNSRLTFDENVTLSPLFFNQLYSQGAVPLSWLPPTNFFFTSLLALSACCRVLELFNQHFVPRVFTTKTYWVKESENYH